MAYKVVITTDAEQDLNRFIYYLINEKKSRQVAINVLNDFEQTVQELATVAGSLKLCDNPRLYELGYRRINFRSHKYFMLYRIQKKTVVIDRIFHDLQDYENKMQ